ncbi:hypothetical protein K461DRAFT_266539 [Myriangium duriaei CBS 260.36]|uniref:Mid2 domain-containing protein n=1 Tax=Myriangium duriaei CBS 260.36 TaxID=1168546 RepID=A0A9P4J5Y3_9PEZI|nr:hypothetical protein K461DRAFT_266539 [Myriangium duriaei CBS 260.36]
MFAMVCLTPRVLVVTIGLALLANEAAAVCYRPNGTIQVSDYNPCYASLPNSFCCATQKGVTEGDPTDHDNCLPNGLCQYIGGTTDRVYEYWREGCTNSSWPSEWCLTGVCTSENLDYTEGNYQLTPCDNTPASRTWCCGQNNTACCGKGAPNEITLAPTLKGYAALSTTLSSSATSSTVPASSSSLAGSASASSTPVGTNGPSGSSKIGIGVGVGVGVVALIIFSATLFLLYRRRREKRLVDESVNLPAYRYDAKHDTPGGSRDVNGLSELETGPERERAELQTPFLGTEMDAQSPPVELEAAVPTKQERKDSSET